MHRSLRTVPLHAATMAALLAGGARADAMTYGSETVNGKGCDTVAWTDANGQPRKVWLVRGDGDVNGYKGGYIEKYAYTVNGAAKTGMAYPGTQEGVSGLGCAVNHHSSYSSSKANTANQSTAFLLQGPSHCIWRFQGDYSGESRTIGLKIDYVISEGRNEVLWAVSYDASALADTAIQWDARGPYFQFDWDNDGAFYNTPISGIGWGDKFKFRTVSYVWNSPSTTTWDYTQANTIPHSLIWKDAGIGDLEAGVVQTQPWSIKDAGGYWFSTEAPAGTRGGGHSGTGMPQNYDCPFQLNAYESYSGEKSAWGTPFGFVGSSAYSELDYAHTRVGWPTQGYSTYIVLDRHADGLTDALVGSMEGVQQTTLTASVGTVATSGPKYAGLSGTAAYAPAGWNHVYGAWTVATASNEAAVNASVGGGKTVLRPLFAFTGYTAAGAPAQVLFNDVALTAGSGYAVSLDATSHVLWLTLLRNLGGAANTLAITQAAAGTASGTTTGTGTGTTTSGAATGGGSASTGCGIGAGIGAVIGLLLLAARGGRRRPC